MRQNFAGVVLEHSTVDGVYGLESKSYNSSREVLVQNSSLLNRHDQLSVHLTVRSTECGYVLGGTVRFGVHAICMEAWTILQPSILGCTDFCWFHPVLKGWASCGANNTGRPFRSNRL